MNISKIGQMQFISSSSKPWEDAQNSESFYEGTPAMKWSGKTCLLAIGVMHLRL